MLGSEYPFVVQVIDVDANESLLEQFDELVPVLFGQKSEAAAVRLCHYFFDEPKVRAFLSGAEQGEG